MEVWRKIEGFENYSVSTYGRVRNDKSGRILQYKSKTSPRKGVTLSKGKIRFQASVHRLVAQAFLPNPENLPEVNHIDEDPSNNHVTNLEWCTHLYNMNFGTRTERALKNNPQCRPILLDGELFPSVKSAARHLNCWQSALSKALNKGLTEFRGHTISYA